MTRSVRARVLAVVVVVAVMVTELAGCAESPASRPASPTIGVIPFSEPDLVNPLRGQYQNLMEPLFPQGSDLNRGLPAWPGASDVSARIPWKSLQPKDPRRLPPGAPDSRRYDFSALDRAIADAAAQGKRFGFRVTAFDSCCDVTQRGGTVSSVPDWLRGIPDATETYVVDGVRYVVPQWNSAEYLDRFTDLVAALGRRYDRDERLAIYEMSGYGDFSENHVAFVRDDARTPGPSPEESRARLGYYSQYRDQYITSGSAARLVDATLRAFRSTRVVSAMGNPEIARLLLRDSAALAGVRHPVGVRSDSLGTYPVIPTWAENQWSQYVVERDPIVALLSRRYRTAPVLTEWPPQMLTGGTVLDYYRRAVSQVVDGHVSMTSSTGFPAQSRPERMTSEQYDLWSRATKYAGYRYAVTAAGLAPASDRDPATLTIRWANFGSAPTYDRWTTTYEFVDGEGRSVASVPAGVDLSTLFASPTVPYEDTAASPPVAETTDTVAVPLLPGAYVLWVKVAWSEHKLDATHRMELPPMNLALRGRDCDGAYPVGKIDVR